MKPPKNSVQLDSFNQGDLSLDVIVSKDGFIVTRMPDSGQVVDQPRPSYAPLALFSAACIGLALAFMEDSKRA